MTSALYHGKESSSFPYSVPSRRQPSDSNVRQAENTTWSMQAPLFRPSPPRLPSLTAQFSHHPPPTPQTPTTRQPTKVAKRWLEGKSVSRREGEQESSDDSDTPVTITMGDSVTMTKMEWLKRGHDLLERAWQDMVLEKGTHRRQPESATFQGYSATFPTQTMYTLGSATYQGQGSATYGQGQGGGSYSGQGSGQGSMAR
jgi:hypothetical protein